MIADLIKRLEGLRLRVYDDATGEELRPGYMLVGHPTIGYGRALDVNGISKFEAENFRQTDTTKAVNICHEIIPVFGDLDAVRQAALVAMAYQLGRGGLGRFGRMISALEAKDYKRAAGEALDSLWARQTPERAETLAEMLLTGRET